MFGSFERFVAFRYLRAKRQEGFISVVAWFSLLGIMLGVATLIIVMAVMNGFRHDLLDRVIGLNGHITVEAQDGSIEPYEDITRQLTGLRGVEQVTPLVEGQVMATAENQAAGGALVRGIHAADFAARDILREALTRGDLEGFDDGLGIIIGIRMANRLRVGVGDKVTLIAPKGSVTAFGTVPRVKAFDVKAIFSVGMYEYDNSFVYMPFQVAQRYFNSDGAATDIEIMIDDAEAAESQAYEINRLLGGDYRVLGWQRVNASFFNALQVERNVMFLILTLIILVAAFNVISSQIMLVKDKGRGIAILRTMGASRATILRIFFITGSSVGVIGTALGAALGIAFALNIETIRQWIEGLSGANLFAAEIYFLSKLPARVETGEVISVVVMALTLSLLASIYPAWRAARLDPVEVLRYE
ncbi:lipoprotein-releasing ABC transporter permease subunit [Marivibrio halodurans]|uniref:Lipoprotein-releasing ABC transporter permease subunit n=1 Tax=Marivibrio halodurans TaxID=2039722 RepID=A0A8J7RVZ1_9PROT|nr:lipoprotein-releasing ABC transporter permease subunit [Marivibrio halodurans]MBP5855545.1 lipoprotein-releasing ABC transporter permease subunit [Marivibrio halodurans]